MRNACQLSSVFDAFLRLIPDRLSLRGFSLSPKAFVRQSKLTLSAVFVLPVEAFVHSDRSEATLTLTPPKAGPISLRVVRLVAPDGNVSVLLTNLNDSIRFPATAVIARILMVLSTDPDDPAAAASQFKHAMITLAEEAFVLTPRCPQQARAIFRELLSEIARVRYYPQERLSLRSLAYQRSPSPNGRSIKANESPWPNSTALTPPPPLRQGIPSVSEKLSPERVQRWHTLGGRGGIAWLSSRRGQG